MSVSRSLKTTPTSHLCTVAGGCFWGTQHLFDKTLGDRIIDTEVGFANGTASHPSYKQVCAGNTGHTEALQISYDPSQISYKELVDFFFRIHDPTTLNYQGHDTGIQYRSAILTHSDEQTAIAHKSLAEAQQKWYPNNKIVTSIEPINSFWDAEDYHQHYQSHHPEHRMCSTHFIRTEPL